MEVKGACTHSIVSMVEPSGFLVEGNRRDTFVESVLTDEALNELKRQSTNFCLLCLFDAWEAEEWD